ncbi:m7GpppN-mRNA hydrolase [Anthonomus grandis grandis]|uniref:m7GpppN-mRNA hydrolase n=1 Tax=Anthonomus grandis grandis TaxID=2921223 RepID=UPI0021654A22|nr:m7GpppN-mRNA hydrolase [Anthonomus grandis grandis]
MSEKGIIEHTIPFDVLNDVLTRFIILVPEEAKENLIRIFFQIELAHWFYLDFYVGNDPRCKTCTIYEFAAHVFQHIPSLKSEIPRLHTILQDWKTYKQSVPTYGAIILSEGLTHVLLVQSYWARASWGFPKGKVNEEEDPTHCAIREVFEETSFDISPYLNPNEYLESILNDQLVRLYIIKNVSMDTEFKPRTRCEIKACSWFAISDLPNNKKDSTPKISLGVKSNSFFMILPFVKKIKQICNSHNSARRIRQKNTSITEGEISIYKSKNKEEDDELKLIKKRDKKHSKRQLFLEESSEQAVEFTAKSWSNFSFDLSSITNCLD